MCNQKAYNNITYILTDKEVYLLSEGFIRHLVAKEIKAELHKEDTEIIEITINLKRRNTICKQ